MRNGQSTKSVNFLRDSLIFRTFIFCSLIIVASIYKVSDSHAANETPCKQPTKSFWERTADDPIAVFTLALSIFSGVLAVYTGIMGHATRRLVRGAEDTAKRQLRAYVSISDGLIRLINNNTAVEILITYKNSGVTPGYDFKTTTRMEVRDATDHCPYSELSPPLAKSIIAPNAPTTVGPNVLNLSPEELAGIRDGTRKIHIWGRADYIDVFNEERYFLFWSTNGKAIDQVDLATNRILWSGWPVAPGPEGYKAN